MTSTIYLAKNLNTGKLVFIEAGEKYDQSQYQLMFAVTADDVLRMINRCH
ncbi:hypothetical protein AAS21_gp105 [Pantoea phage vB_PagS_AAS21]|uniref:Uncharacterized protein n=1 Tax=Pantoea phage vB_PagS_AAS21 TaxID=2575261 RepID=A0A4Y5P1X5_9CAUD|nr:hypothetical protein AAS21_gp105 [Pantoea phage vB_PagS_AAS21]